MAENNLGTNISEQKPDQELQVKEVLDRLHSNG